MRNLQQKIAEDLIRRIDSGDLRPGDFLPTEPLMEAQYRVSRTTVRGAASRLVHAGLIERVPGKHGGMRVRARVRVTHFASRAELPGQPPSESDTFFREIREQGMMPSQEFRLRIEPLPADLAARLEVDAGSSAVVRQCVRSVNGRPTSIQSTYYPAWLTEQVTELLEPHDIAIGTTQLLAQRGIVQVALVDACTARMPAPAEVTDLQLRAGTPVLEYVRIGYTADRAVRVSVHVLAGDSNRIVHTLGDPGALARVVEP